MLRKLTLSLLLMAGSGATVLAHHGWGSYDASKPITVTGSIEASKYENARHHHRQDHRQGVDGDTGARVAHAGQRRVARARRRRQDRLGLRLLLER